MFEFFELPDDPPAIRRIEEPLYRTTYGLRSINHTEDKYPAKENQKREDDRKENGLIANHVQHLPTSDGITEIRMTCPCYFELMQDLTGKQPEQAGLMFGPVNDDSLVTHYVPENEGMGTLVTFTINGDFVNRQIRRFKAAELDLKGIVHSHPPYFNQLSGGDLRYLRRLLGKPKNRGTEAIFMPIVCGNRFIPFLVDSEINVTRPRLELV